MQGDEGGVRIEGYLVFLSDYCILIFNQDHSRNLCDKMHNSADSLWMKKKTRHVRDMIKNQI